MGADPMSAPDLFTPALVPTEEPMPREPREFQWRPENEDIIVPRQPALAIFRNAWDQIIIRQERDWDDEDDAYIRISRENLSTVIARLQAIQRGED
jgi:hypothetical protein